MAASYRFVVAGRVQGVGFRESARRKAEQLNLGGWIANRPDGAVEGVVSGEDSALGRFNTWLSDGPPTARVLTLKWQPTPEFVSDGFHIRQG